MLKGNNKKKILALTNTKTYEVSILKQCKAKKLTEMTREISNRHNYNVVFNP